MQVQRYETIIFDEKSYKFHSTGELEADCRIARCGIQKYLVGGKVIRELRPPDEVFKEDSLDTLRGRAIVNNHPFDEKGQKVYVTLDNRKQLEIGTVIDRPYREGNFLRAKLLVTDKATIEDLKLKRKREISGGYISDVELNPGVYEGQEYDTIQHNIRYNHIAFVNMGRAGSDVVLRLDENDGELILDDSTNEETTMAEATVKTEVKVKVQAKEVVVGQVKFDAIDVTLPEEYAKSVESIVSRADKAIDLLTAKTGELSTLQGKFDAAEAENKTLKANQLDPVKLKAAVKERVKLNLVASFFKIDKVDEIDDNIELMKAVIKAHSKTVDLTNKDNNYVIARYDSIAEGVVEKAGKGFEDLMKLSMSGKTFKTDELHVSNGQNGNESMGGTDWMAGINGSHDAHANPSDARHKFMNASVHAWEDTASKRDGSEQDTREREESKRRLQSNG